MKFLSSSLLGMFLIAQVQASPVLHLSKKTSLSRCGGTITVQPVKTIQFTVVGAQNCSKLQIESLDTTFKLEKSPQGHGGVFDIPAETVHNSRVIITSNSGKHADSFRIYDFGPSDSPLSYDLPNCGGKITAGPDVKANIALNDVVFCSKISVGNQVYFLRGSYPNYAGDFLVPFALLNHNTILVSNQNQDMMDSFGFSSKKPASYKYPAQAGQMGSSARDCSDEVIQAAIDKMDLSSFSKKWARFSSKAEFLRESKKKNLVYEVTIPKSIMGSNSKFEVVAEPTRCEIRNVKQLD